MSCEFFFFLVSSYVSSQTASDTFGIICGTVSLSSDKFAELPYYNEPNLAAIVDDMVEDAPELSPSTNPCNQLSNWSEGVRLPVSIYNFFGEMGVPQSESDIQNLLDDAMTIFRDNGFPITLYVNCFNRIQDETFVNVSRTSLLDSMMDTYNSAHSLDIYLFQSSEDQWGGIYNRSHDRIAISITESNSGTLAHELGHLFGLGHTHRSTNLDPVLANADGLDMACDREFVSRATLLDPSCNFPTGCLTSGDGFCDTPADPSPNGLLVRAADPLGVAYNPERSNVMSYYTSSTQTFSQSQIDAIYLNILNRSRNGVSGQNFWSWAWSGGYVLGDDYEPDNNQETAREIGYNEDQNRSIHTSSPSCLDTDWIKIPKIGAIGTSGDLEVTISSHHLCDLPLTSVGLYTQVGSSSPALVSSTTVVAGQKTISLTIECSNLVNTDHLLNLISSGTSSSYSVKTRLIRPSITLSSNTACEGVTASINGLEDVDVVEWRVFPQIDYTSDGDVLVIGNSVITSSGVTISATVERNGCVYELEPVFASAPQDGAVPDYDLLLHDSPFCYPDAPATLYIKPIANGVQYEWELLSGFGDFEFLYADAVANFFPDDPHTYTIRVTATRTNGCLEQNEVIREQTVQFQDCTPWGLVAYPNPTDGIVYVEHQSQSSVGIKTITVEDLMGQVLLSQQTQSDNSEVFLGDLPEGLYYLKSASSESIKSILIRVAK